jgi:multiple sugar transport system permease protein
VSEKASSWRAAEARAAWTFLAPALTLLGLFFVVPTLAAFVLSLTDFDIYAIGDTSTVRFVGFGNYTRLLGDPLFWKVVGNTLYYALGTGILSVSLGLLVALAVNSRLAKFKGFYRTIFFAPWTASLVAVAVVWRYLYQPKQGLLAMALQNFGLPDIDWLGDVRFAMPAIIILGVWKSFGYNVVLFIAGLHNIPGSLYEAAEIDGASTWQRFRYITLPMLKPTFVLVGTVTAIGNLQVFAEPYVMTRGGNPLDSTLTLVMWMYKEGFRWWNLGQAAAISFLLFALVLGAAAARVLVQRLRRKDEPA